MGIIVYDVSGLQILDWQGSLGSTGSRMESELSRVLGGDGRKAPEAHAHLQRVERTERGGEVGLGLDT